MQNVPTVCDVRKEKFDRPPRLGLEDILARLEVDILLVLSLSHSLSVLLKEERWARLSVI